MKFRLDVLDLIKTGAYTEATKNVNANIDISYYQATDNTQLQKAIIEAYRAHIHAIWERNTADIWGEYDLDYEIEKFENEPLVDLIVALINRGVDFSSIVENQMSAMAILKSTSINLYSFLERTFGAERVQSMIIEPPAPQPILAKTLEEAIAKKDWARAIHFIQQDDKKFSDSLQEENGFIVIDFVKQGTDVADHLQENSDFGFVEQSHLQRENEYLQKAVVDGYQAHLDRIYESNMHAVLYPEYNLDYKDEEFDQEPIVDFIVLLLEKGLDFATPLQDGNSTMTLLKNKSVKLYDFLCKKFGANKINAMLGVPILPRPRVVCGM